MLVESGVDCLAGSTVTVCWDVCSSSKDEDDTGVTVLMVCVTLELLLT